MDFNDVQARTLAERKREEEKQRRLDRIYKEKVEKATMDMEGMPLLSYDYLHSAMKLKNWTFLLQPKMYCTCYLENSVSHKCDP